MDREHHLRRRAEQVRLLLDGLWGDSAPPGRDPRLTVLVDALTGDDENGRAGQVVVRGDDLTYRQLVEAVTGTGEPCSRLARLPAPLLAHLRSSGALDPPLVSRGMAALPDERAGAWELDAATGVLSFDSVTARLLGVGATEGWCDMESVGLQALHPDDQFHVASALEEALTTRRPYQVRFRTRQPHGDYSWRASRARVLAGERSDALRLVGFVAADE